MSEARPDRFVMTRTGQWLAENAHAGEEYARWLKAFRALPPEQQVVLDGIVTSLVQDLRGVGMLAAVELLGKTAEFVATNGIRR